MTKMPKRAVPFHSWMMGLTANPSAISTACQLRAHAMARRIPCAKLGPPGAKRDWHEIKDGEGELGTGEKIEKADDGDEAKTAGGEDQGVPAVHENACRQLGAFLAENQRQVAAVLRRLGLRVNGGGGHRRVPWRCVTFPAQP